MVRSMLDISLDPYDNRIHGSKTRFKPWHKEVMRTLRPLADLAFSNPRQFVVDASSPKAPKLFAALADLMKRKVAKPVGGLRITEQLLDDEDRNVEWFEIAPVPLTGYGWVYPKPILLFAQLPPDRREWPALNRYAMRTIKASEQRPGRHLASRGMSERVKALVEAHHLTGLELLWIPDTGHVAALQWYLPVATEPLGRGQDHPWFDPACLAGLDPKKALKTLVDPTWRVGVTELSSSQFRPGVCCGDPAKDGAIALCGDAVIESHRRVLRGYLPRTDFAYTWGRGSVHEAPGCQRAWREPCCNRRTRDLLIAAGLATEDYFLGIEVLDQPYAGTEVLDELAGGPAGPGPYVPPEAMPQVRAELDRWYAAFLARPRRQPAKRARTSTAESPGNAKSSHPKPNASKSALSARKPKPDPAVAPKPAKKPAKRRRVTVDGAASQDAIAMRPPQLFRRPSRPPGTSSCAPQAARPYGGA